MRCCFVLILGAALSTPASAQVLLSGEWQPLTHEDATERSVGPDLGDYLGIPINDAARLRAESWDASRLTLQEQQCRVHIVSYIYRGPMAFRIWEEKDPDTQQVIAIKNYISTYEQTRTIWMDGRPHPPDYAPHTWMGFSTGKWEGNILTVTTTHIKMGWLRRNGLPESDLATLTEHFIRHGNRLSHISIVTDPVYLTEPLIKSDDFILNLNQNINWLWPCEYVVEVVNRPKGQVPHFLPGQNPFLHEFIDRTKVPAVAARRRRVHLSRIPLQHASPLRPLQASQSTPPRSRQSGSLPRAKRRLPDSRSRRQHHSRNRHPRRDDRRFRHRRRNRTNASRRPQALRQTHQVPDQHQHRPRPRRRQRKHGESRRALRPTCP